MLRRPPNRRIDRAWLLGALICAACAKSASPAPPREAVRGAPATESPPQGPTARQQLLDALQASSGESPLDALPEPVRDDLDHLVAGWSAGERKAAADSDLYAQIHPVWYWWSGGTAPEAARAAVTTSAAAADLLMARRAAGGLVDARLAGVSGAVSRRAAELLLREYGRRLASADALAPEDYLAMASLTRQAGRAELEALAMEVAAGEHDAPALRSRLATVRARALDIDGAEQALGPAPSLEPAGGSGPQASRQVTLARAAAERAIEAARRVAAASPKLDRDGAIAAARAALTLERYDDAPALLGEHRRRAAQDLAVASVVARALTRGNACPGLPTGTGNAALCGVSAAADRDFGRATELMRKAWKTGQGRDRRALETYFGLSHVVPLGATAGRLERDRALTRLLEELSAMREPSERMRALEAFVEILRDEQRRSIDEPTATPRTPDEAPRGLLHEGPLHERADRIARAPFWMTLAGPLGRTVALAEAARWGPGDATAKVLDALNRTPEGSDRPRALALLQLERGLVAKDDALVGRARNALTDVMLEADSFERSGLLLLMAEADFAHRPSERTRSVLRKVAEPLAALDTPRRLRFRAALDLAGLDHREGKLAEAKKRVAAVAGVEGPLAGPAPALARAYLRQFESPGTSEPGTSEPGPAPRAPRRTIRLDLRYGQDERLQPQVEIELWWLPVPVPEPANATAPAKSTG